MGLVVPKNDGRVSTDRVKVKAREVDGCIYTYAPPSNPALYVSCDLAKIVSANGWPHILRQPSM